MEKFKYNIFHPVVLYNVYSNYVIDFIIISQFNKLNFNNFLLQT